jgi:NhaA family Na+:H+ antiporter
MASSSAEPRGVLARFIQSESAGSVVLLAATVAALAWANSPWAPSYDALLHLKLGVSLGERTFALTLHHWVNDGLMALFFFVVGLEVKRELVLGQLSTLRGAILPVAAAAGGMVVPALIFSALNGGGAGARGWGVPMATDIAFALGVLALLGRRVPLGLKVFLAAVAIADDIGAVLVISIYYTEKLHLGALAAAGGLLLALWLVGRTRIRSTGVYAVLVAGVWLATLASGVHATVAGIVIAFLVPVRSTISPEHFLEEVGSALRDLAARPLSRESLVHDAAGLERLESVHLHASALRPPALVFEQALHPVTTWFVLPVFALFNAGIALEGGVDAAIRSPVALGVLLGLLAGKVLGIVGASWLAIRLRLAALPEGVALAQIAGAGVLAGIGFTMSIFVASLAFADAALETAAKVGILGASALAGVAGYLALRALLPAPREEPSPTPSAPSSQRMSNS